MGGGEIDEVADVEIVESDLTAGEARHLTDQIKTGLGVVWQQVVSAYQGRAWLALGHANWDSYIRAEFGSMNLQPPREERDQVIASLRDSGMSVRAIATATTLSRGTVGNTIRSAEQAGVQNWTPDENAAGEQSAEPRTVQGIDGKQYAAARPTASRQEPAEQSMEDAPLPRQVSIADELGDDAGDAASGSVLEMTPQQAGIEVVDLDANDHAHREQARRDLREFHASGHAAVHMTIKLAARLSASVAPSMGESPLTDEERAAVINDSARCVRTLASLLGRTAGAAEVIAADDAAAEETMSNVTDAVDDLNRAVDGWRTKR